MARIERVRVALTGFIGAPGVCTFYGLNATALYPEIVNLWGGLALKMPSRVSIKVENSGDALEDTTGAVVGSWSIASATGVAGADNGPYAAPIGACLTWLTETILDRHRIKGRTFVVPLGDSQYAQDGTLQDATVVDLSALCATYVTAGTANALIWHRPVTARAATPTRPARVARAGGHGIITGSRVKDQVAVLRSRRD